MASNSCPSVDDIEDIVTKDSPVTDLRASNKKHVVPRARKVKDNEGINGQDLSADSVIPGKNY